MAVEYVTGSIIEYGADAKSYVVDAPANVQENDIIVAVWTSESTDITTHTWPSGFTQWAVNSPLGSSYCSIRVGWRRATDSEPATYTFSHSNRSEQHAGIVLAAYRGAKTSDDPTDGEPISNTDYITSDLNIIAAGITLTQEALVLFCSGWWDSPSTIDTYPSGFTYRGQGRDGNHAAAIADKSFSSGATGDQTGTFATYDVRDKHAFLVPLVAAAAGAASLCVPSSLDGGLYERMAGGL